MKRFADSARASACVACGMLGWRLDDFWRATPADLLMIIDGLQAPVADAVLGPAELKQMMERDADG